jgi:hypothetical protein
LGLPNNLALVSLANSNLGIVFSQCSKAIVAPLPKQNKTSYNRWKEHFITIYYFKDSFVLSETMELIKGFLMRIKVVTLLPICVVLFLSSCQFGKINDSLPKSTDEKSGTQETNIESLEPKEMVTQEENTVATATYTVEWSEISEDGVNEDEFLENMDTELLKEIATELQTLVEEIQQKQMEDPESVLRGEWISDITESDRYKAVVNMGPRAMKPLYWIIYKSDNQGLYEYICCMALEELSGYDFTDENGTGWAMSKDFLNRFTKRILNDKK